MGALSGPPPATDKKEIAYALGYQHPNDFSRAFRRIVGKSPIGISSAVSAR